MTEYYYEAEAEPQAQPARRVRFDPTRDRGADYFAKAHRHSRRVLWLKILLPALAVAGIAGFFVVMEFGSDQDAAVITLAGVNVDTKSVEMKQPHISGFEGTRRAYEVRAVRAVQDLDNPKVVTLQTITARFSVGNGVTATVEAATGVFDGATKGLVLKNGILLTTSNGYHAKLVEAAVDLDKGHLLTSKPVEITGAEGTIKANSMEIVDHGAKVFFGKGVSVTFIPQDDKPKDGEASAAPAPADKKPPSAEAKTADGPT